MVLMVAAYELILWTPFDDDELKLSGHTTTGIDHICLVILSQPMQTKMVKTILAFLPYYNVCSPGLTSVRPLLWQAKQTVSAL